jgi:hypothetical protein
MRPNIKRNTNTEEGVASSTLTAEERNAVIDELLHRVPDLEWVLDPETEPVHPSSETRNK